MRSTFVGRKWTIIKYKVEPLTLGQGVFVHAESRSEIIMGLLLTACLIYYVAQKWTHQNFFPLGTCRLEDP